MPEIQHAPLADNHEPRSVHYVGLALDQGFEDMTVFPRIVLEIGVLDDAELAARLLDCRPDRRALTPVAVVAEHPDPIRTGSGDLLGDLGRAVGRAVVDHDDLAIDAVGKRGVDDALEQGPNELLLGIKR